MTTVDLPARHGTSVPVPRGPLRPPKVPRPSPAPRTTDPFIAKVGQRIAELDTFGTRRLLGEFWDHHRRSGTPRVGPVDHDGTHLVTFLWRDPLVGGRPADGVVLFVNRLTDERDLARSAMDRLPGSDIWHLSVRMAGDWRAGYAFIPVEPGSTLLTETDQVLLRQLLDRGVPDPFNADRIWSRNGGERSVVSLPLAPAQPWFRPRAAVPAGLTTRHRSPDLTGYPARDVWVHRPAGVPTDAPLPVLLLLDGEVWAEHVPIAPTLANLTAAGLLPPMITVMPHGGTREQRWQELIGDRAVIDTLADDLLPAILGRRPDTVTVAGVSLAGLTAVAAALLRPDRFTAAACLSGSLWWTEDRLDAAEPTLHRWAREAPPGARFDLQVGTQEWVLTGPHRDLARVLQDHDHPVRLTEYNGGHDFACWRGGLADALLRLHTDPHYEHGENPR